MGEVEFRAMGQAEFFHQPSARRVYFRSHRDDPLDVGLEADPPEASGRGFEG
jgi:hypothetical protein